MMDEYFYRKWAYYDMMRNAGPTEYVMDGLQLWLDGINNTRHGHNPYARIWEDLSGNDYDFYPKNPGKYPTAYDDHWSGWTADTFFINTDDGLTAYADATKKGTLEVVFRTDTNENTGQIFGFKNGVGTSAYRGKLFVKNGENYIVLGRQTSTTNARYLFKNVGHHYNELCQASIIYTGDNAMASAIIGGETYTTLEGESTGWGNGGANAIGNRVHTTSTTSQDYKGNIYCIRYYNRILTDAERQQNRLVDARRFG